VSLCVFVRPSAEIFAGTARGNEGRVSQNLARWGASSVYVGPRSVGRIFDPSDELSPRGLVRSLHPLGTSTIRRRARGQSGCPLARRSTARSVRSILARFIAVTNFTRWPIVVRDILSAQQTSWLIVGGAFATSERCCSGSVHGRAHHSPATPSF
jgi:hypothetical protein